MSGEAAMGGGASKSNSWTSQDKVQEGFNRILMGQGSALANYQSNPGGPMNANNMQTARGLQNGMQGMFGNLGQTASGQSGAMQGLAAQGAVGGGNPYLQNNLDALGSNIQYQMGLGNQMIGQGAVASGGFGGGRQGVAQGALLRGGLDAFQQGASALMNQASGQSLQANTAMGGLQNQAGMGGIQGAGSIFEMGMNPYMAQWMPMQMQKGIIGAPVMNSGSDSGAWNGNIAAGGGGGGGGK
jgi:hypothetical protein